MIVLPLFWDQYDNAQRVQDLGFGVQLDTYGFDDGELASALGRLLANEKLRKDLDASGAAIRSRDGIRVAADLIEGVARGLSH